MRRAVLAAIVLASCGVTVAQDPAAPSGQIERVSTVMRDYGRAVTERRFLVTTKISVLDSAGNVQQVKHTKHQLEFSKGRYRGTTPDRVALEPDAYEDDPDWFGAIHVTGSRRTIGYELYTDSAVFFPTFAFDPNRRTRPGAAGGANISHKCAGGSPRISARQLGHSLVAFGRGDVLLVFPAGLQSIWARKNIFCSSPIVCCARPIGAHHLCSRK